jgi:hypothetical protein
MRYWKYLALLTVLMVPLAYSQAQVGFRVGVAVGPGYVAGPPVCAYGYYDYYPYTCAPYGYYGPNWFANGIFIGAGPWYHSYWGRGWDRDGRGFARGGWGYGREGYRSGYGRGYARGSYGNGYAHGGYGRGSYGNGYARGGVHAGNSFHGGGGYHGGGESHGGGGFHGGGGGFHGGGGHGGGRR